MLLIWIIIDDIYDVNYNMDDDDDGETCGK